MFEPVLRPDICIFYEFEKVAIIDQNGKGLAFTFWPILAIFSTS